MQDNRFKFIQFLRGSSPSDKNQSLVKFLPDEILHKIWLDYMTSSHTLEELIEGNHVECVKYAVLEKKMEYNNSNFGFVNCNNFELYQWLHDNDRSLSFGKLVASSNVKIIDLEIEKQLEKDKSANNPKCIIRCLAEYNPNTHILKHTVQKHYSDAVLDDEEFYERLLDRSVQGDNYDVSKWIIEESQMNPIEEYILNDIVQRGNVDMCRWTKEKNLFPPEFINRPKFLYRCVMSGDLDMLNLFEKEIVDTNTNSIMPEAMDIIITNNDYNMFVWLHERIRFKCTFLMLLYSTDDHNDATQLTRYIYDHKEDGYTLEEAIKWACSYNNTYCVKFLLNEANYSRKYIEQAIMDASCYGGADVLLYLYNHHKRVFETPGLVNDCMYAAMERSKFVDNRKCIEFFYSLTYIE